MLHYEELGTFLGITDDYSYFDVIVELLLELMVYVVAYLL